MANPVSRNTLLSALEEIRRHQMKKFLLHRLYLVAMLKENTESAEVTAFHEKLFQRIAKFHLGEPVSGVLLIYPCCILHILESSSGTLYHILKELAITESEEPEPFLRDVKILVVTHNIPTKLFTQWYATAVEVPETLEDVTQTQTSEEVITECLTLILKLGVYLTTLKVGSKGLGDCLHNVVPELLIPMETIKYLCKANDCLRPQEFLDMYNNPLQPIMDSGTISLLGSLYALNDIFFLQGNRNSRFTTTPAFQNLCGRLLLICLYEPLAGSLNALPQFALLGIMRPPRN